MAKLAINGGEKAITIDHDDALYNRALTDDQLTKAVLDFVGGGVLFSDERFPGETILQFEEEFAKWRGVKYALAHTNGTSAIQAALFAVGVGPGDEVIVPSYTHPFSVVPILGANAIPVFCDVDPDTLCADPVDIARRVTPHTKAIVPVHGNIMNEGMPCEMDAIMAIAEEHDLAVVEHVSTHIGVMYLGHLVELAPRDQLYNSPKHPYTRALLDSVPVADPENIKTVSLEGEVPSPLNPPAGCTFHPRCKAKMDQCSQKAPNPTEVSEGHFVTCHLYEQSVTPR